MEEHYLYYLDTRIRLRRGQSYTLGRDPANAVCLPDQRVSRRHASLRWSGSGFVLVDLKSTNGTYVNSGRAASIRLLDGDRIRIGPHDLQYLVHSSEEDTAPEPDDTLLFERKVHELAREVNDPSMAAKIRDLKNDYNLKHDILSDLAFRDELTGCFNRRFFELKLKDEVERASRYGRALSVIMLDIDHFKKFNDTYGHQKGDEILRNVAAILRDSCRSSDTVARYGGEELVVILPETDGPGAALVAEKARKAIAARAGDEVGTRVTVSMGVAAFGADRDGPEALVAAADKSLYAAKDLGRNRSVMDGMDLSG